MANKAKFAFGESSGVSEALSSGKINARDILFLDENTDSPKIGWITRDGKPVILTDEKADLSEVESDVAALEAEMDACENTHEKIKYEITDVPVGTLIDYGENEIRICCPSTTVWTKQTVGEGGDPNCYYATLKTYVYDENVTGYKEHLGDQVDAEILTDLKTDEYGRRYQPSWLALAKYDETTDTWNYYGANSNSEHFVGWDYRLDMFNADGVMIASDSIRINLSNEDCHSVIEPYYVGEMMKTIDEKIDEKLAGLDSAWEIVEF